MSGFVMDNMILVCLKLVETSAFCGEHAAEQVDLGCKGMIGVESATDL